MLNLTVRVGGSESVYLVDRETDIPIARISLLSMKGNQVNVGIQAKNTTHILRNKLVDDQKQEQYDLFLKN